jgi:hypothetical protein
VSHEDIATLTPLSTWPDTVCTIIECNPVIVKVSETRDVGEMSK